MPSSRRKIAIVGVAGAAILLFCTSTTPVDANVFTKLGQIYGCVVTWGQVCDLSETVVGTGQPTQPIPVTCARPLLNGLPKFLSWPKGSAKYRFQSTCSSPAKPGAVMTVRWEGSWTPSETKTDRPNASETLQITGFEPFLPDRAPGGKIFMYWTARCIEDPWLKIQSTTGARNAGEPKQGELRDVNSLRRSKEMRGLGQLNTGRLNDFNSARLIAKSNGCTPFGAYVPDDLRQALPDIDKQSFPRTGNIISSTDRQQLYAEYQRANPSYSSRLDVQQPMSSKTLQQATIPQSSGIVRNPSKNLQLFSRGTDAPEQAQPESQDQQNSSPDVAPSSVGSLSEGIEDEAAIPQTAITFDQPLHFLSANGEDTLIAADIYEIEPVLDLQLSLTREGESAVLLPATQGTHSETIQQPMALLVQEESNDEQHLVFLTPDGKRFETVGSLSGVKSRGTGLAVALPNRKLKDAIIQASAKPASGPGTPCLRSTLPVGPRWLPPGCNMPGPIIQGAAPVPYLDESNLLHACLNNNTGVFRVVHPLDACMTQNGEIKIKWQLAP